MKTIPYLFVLVFLTLTSCGDEQPTVEPVQKPNQLFVIVYDISKSNDSYAFLKSEHFSEIYSYMGYNGGGKMYGLFVKANSESQEPFSIAINPLDTIAYRGNRIQIGNIKQNNRLVLNKFEAGRNDFISKSSNALIKDKNEMFSDVQNALLLVKQIVNTPEYSNWSKKVLIVSDMENDAPPIEGLDPIIPIEFGSKVSIGIVRPSNRVAIPKIFPKLTVTNYSTIEDGIKSLITLNF
jgi:hypothetical protein